MLSFRVIGSVLVLFGAAAELGRQVCVEISVGSSCCTAPLDTTCCAYDRDMNAKRRKALEKLGKQIETIKEEIGELKDEEQECFDNMHENFQNGEEESRKQKRQSITWNDLLNL